jgi:hypothetical protein
MLASPGTPYQLRLRPPQIRALNTLARPSRAAEKVGVALFRCCFLFPLPPLVVVCGVFNRKKADVRGLFLAQIPIPFDGCRLFRPQHFKHFVVNSDEHS